MSDLLKLTASQALKALRNKDFSAKELTQAHLDAAQESNKKLNCFTKITPESALQAAEKSDGRYSKGEGLLLDGIPIGVKELFCAKGEESTSCSNILKGFVSPYESTVTNMAKNVAGAISIGRTNMDQFAMGSANITSADGNVINPWRRKSDDKDLVPGGSSGGSAAAVAAKLCMLAFGSDTGGSVRQPASFCGIVGVKPTYGRCSRHGMISFSSSLDQAACFGRSVEDSALFLQAISGYDPKDSTSMKIDVPDYRANINKSVKGLRIGIPKEYSIPGMPQEILKIWEEGIACLKAAGAQIIDISLPHTQYALPTYYIIAPAEASSNLARYDGIRYGARVSSGKTLDDMYNATRTAGFGNEVKRRILIGTYVLSAGYYDAYYTRAQKVRAKIANDFTSAFEKVDAILTPTAPSGAFAIGENMDDPVKMYLNDVFTVPASLAGLPCMSVPAALTNDGLPISLQVISNSFDEVTMFQVAAELERAANFPYL